MVDSDRQRQCDVHGELSTCVKFAKKGLEECKNNITNAYRRMDEMVSMKVFKILVITLALCLGGLFVITLSTNSKISDLGIDIRGMTKDIATNSRDIKSNTGDLRLLMRKYRIEPTERNGEKQ